MKTLTDYKQEEYDKYRVRLKRRLEFLYLGRKVEALTFQRNPQRWVPKRFTVKTISVPEGNGILFNKYALHEDYPVVRLK